MRMTRAEPAAAVCCGVLGLLPWVLFLFPAPAARTSLQSALSSVAETISKLQESDRLTSSHFFLGSVVLSAVAMTIDGVSSEASFYAFGGAVPAVIGLCPLLSITRVQTVDRGWAGFVDVVLERHALRLLRTLVALEVVGGICVVAVLLAAALFNRVQYRETWPRLHLLTLTLTPIVVAGIVMSILSTRCPACRHRLLWVATGVKQALRATWAATRCPHCSEDLLNSDLKLSNRPVSDLFDRWFVLPAAEAKAKR